MEAKNGLSDILAILNNLHDNIVRMLAFVAGLITIFIMFAISYGVIARKFFDMPIPWVIEVSSYALLFITFLGTPWLLRVNGHIRVDLLYSALSKRNRNILNLITSVLGVITNFILLSYGLAVTVDNWQRHILVMNILATPKFILLAVIPLGSFFLLVEFLMRAWRSAKLLLHFERGK
ncbi:MAG: TRAP transporter small permease subunit [Desulfocucumaceae bacterium]